MNDLPTEPGAYWWRQFPHYEWTFVRVEENEMGRLRGLREGDLFSCDLSSWSDAYRVVGEWVKINPPHATLDALRGNR